MAKTEPMLERGSRRIGWRRVLAARSPRTARKARWRGRAACAA